MRRFLLFGYDSYYPCGGWNDLICDYETAAEAFAIKLTTDFRQIIDTETMKEVQQPLLSGDQQ
jgi:hypothetical protein